MKERERERRRRLAFLPLSLSLLRVSLLSFRGFIPSFFPCFPLVLWCSSAARAPSAAGAGAAAAAEEGKRETHRGYLSIAHPGLSLSPPPSTGVAPVRLTDSLSLTLLASAVVRHRFSSPDAWDLPVPLSVYVCVYSSIWCSDQALLPSFRCPPPRLL